jgi:hypothetical protein
MFLRLDFFLILLHEFRTHSLNIIPLIPMFFGINLVLQKAAFLRFKIILIIDVWVVNSARVQNTRAK